MPSKVSGEGACAVAGTTNNRSAITAQSSVPPANLALCAAIRSTSVGVRSRPPNPNRSVRRASSASFSTTALPGTDGNSGIAGHRDGFFRGLKDIGPEDAIDLETLRGKEVYRVERTWVVDPEDVSVLDPTPVRSLTLVTCYPFYYVGPAPQRYIVRAVRADTAAPLSAAVA